MILHRLRAAGLVLALAAITFKAFLPPGFMFEAADGRVAIVLCQVGGHTELSFDPLTGAYSDEGAPQKSSGAPHCPFALVGAAAVTTVAPELVQTPALVAIEAAPAQLVERPHAPSVGPPLPARGPPLHA